MTATVHVEFLHENPSQPWSGPLQAVPLLSLRLRSSTQVALAGIVALLDQPRDVMFGLSLKIFNGITGGQAV